MMASNHKIFTKNVMEKEKQFAYFNLKTGEFLVDTPTNNGYQDGNILQEKENHFYFLLTKTRNITALKKNLNYMYILIIYACLVMKIFTSLIKQILIIFHILNLVIHIHVME